MTVHCARANCVHRGHHAADAILGGLLGGAAVALLLVAANHVWGYRQ